MQRLDAALDSFTTAIFIFVVSLLWNLPSSRTGHWGEGMTVEQMAEMQWLKRKLVCQVRFTKWTLDDHLRHVDYFGLRPDQSLTEMIREKPATACSPGFSRFPNRTGNVPAMRGHCSVPDALTFALTKSVMKRGPYWY